MTATVGIDMSLTSPGIACFWAGIWSLWCFAVRKRDENLQWRSVDGAIKLTVLPMIPGPSFKDVDRYRHIITYIQRECVPHWPKDSRLYLENYIFTKPSLAGSSYKIHELGGILKYQLTQTHPHLTTVAPSVWKKKLSGLSGMSKHQTLCCVQARLPQLDLMNLFGFGSTQTTSVVPNPVQDISDAIGIVLAHIDSVTEEDGQKQTKSKFKKARSIKVISSTQDTLKKAKTIKVIRKNHSTLKKAETSNCQTHQEKLRLSKSTKPMLICSV